MNQPKLIKRIREWDWEDRIFHIAEEIPTNSTITIKPNEYKPIPNTYQNQEQIYIRK